MHLLKQRIAETGGVKSFILLKDYIDIDMYLPSAIG
jgi:hypothetical protein